MNHKIITISRQFGSGGRTVGKELAEKLGIPCYDQTLIEKISEKSGFSQGQVKEISEESVPGKFFAGREERVARMLQSSLWQSQKQVILELAQQGPCVIVGRCADRILKDEENCLRVYIHAEIEKRAERIVRVYGERDNTPLERVLDKDKRRRSYYEDFTGCKWGDAENFHVALDSGKLGIETCVKILSELY